MDPSLDYGPVDIPETQAVPGRGEQRVSADVSRECLARRNAAARSIQQKGAAVVGREFDHTLKEAAGDPEAACVRPNRQVHVGDMRVRPITRQDHPRMP
jgi:hypothetical protein